VSAPPGRPSQTVRGRAWATAAAYGLLFVFGVLQAAVGSFQYSRGFGNVPLAAVGFALAIGVTTAACGKGMRATGGALAPAIGWLLTAFLLAMPRPGGSVVITNTLAGQVYLYAGALAAAIGVGLGASAWARRQAVPPPRDRLPLNRRTGT
jgi:hypothetical protein